MYQLKRRQPDGVDPSIVYALVGGFVAFLLMIAGTWLFSSYRRNRRRVRQRVNDARQWELRSLTPGRSGTADNGSVQSSRARYPNMPVPPQPTFTGPRPGQPGPSLHTRSHSSTRITTTTDIDILLDQGTATDDTTFDFERAPPVVNEAYARTQARQNVIFTQMGMTESQINLASDLPDDDEAEAEAEVAREKERERQRAQARVAKTVADKVAPSARSRSAAPMADRRVAEPTPDTHEQSDSTMTPRLGRRPVPPGQSATRLQVPRPQPRSRSRPEAINSSADTQGPSHSRSRSRSRSRSQPGQTIESPPAPRPSQVHESVPSMVESDAPPEIAWSVEPPTPTRPSAAPRRRSVDDDDLPNEESVDSSRLSQIDLGTSTVDDVDGTYMSTDISDDFFREDVEEIRRRQK